MRCLKFTPNSVARSLVTKESRIIGLFLADISNPFFASLTRAVEDAASRNGYAVIICNSDSDPEKENAYISLLRQRYVDGILFLSNSPDRSGLKTAIDGQVPFVVVDEEIKGLTPDGVFVDNERGAYEAVAHLAKLGHRRIAHIAGPPVYSTPLRLAGYRRALDAHHVVYDPNLVRFGDFQTAGGYAAAADLLRCTPRPTAIFAGNDLMAIGAMQAAWRAGLDVGTDVAIVGFDDIPLASALVPALTTVAQPIADLGRVAVRQLVDKIEGRGTRRRIVLPCTLRVRNSCGAMPRADGLMSSGATPPPDARFGAGPASPNDAVGSRGTEVR